MTDDLSIAALRRAYADAGLEPRALFARLRERAAAFSAHNIWIHLLDESELAPYLDALDRLDPMQAPLWGVPFAIKDNIDLAGIPTTAACREFAYSPRESAQVVQRLVAAGAVPIGKTNLDQFATGLNGTRSPWGPCRNGLDPRYISGGSSAGSAVAVALGLASFSLGTDTAGSGRVPACFNNLVGLKPTRGLLSNRGVVPACRSLDCVSVFAFNADDANTVLGCAEGLDADDGYSRRNPFANGRRQYGLHGGPLRIGVPATAALRFFGDDAYASAYRDTLDALRADGVEFVEINYRPFDEAARLLYEGPWVAERYLATLPLIEQSPEVVFPVVRAIIEPGGEARATALFRAEYRLHELRRLCLAELDGLDCLLTPTAGRLYTIDEMLAEPIRRNSELGYYTNFMNLLDLAAVALPTAFTAGGLPFGVTIAADRFADRRLLSIANRIQQTLPLPQGATERAQPPLERGASTDGRHVDLLVCGAHLDGLALNWQLRERGAVLRERTTTAPVYRLYALAGGPPYRPGLVHDDTAGEAIEVEIWRLPAQEFGGFVAAIPAPLGIGRVTVADGREFSGFICEPRAIDGAREITHLGGWRAYLRASTEASGDQQL